MKRLTSIAASMLALLSSAIPTVAQDETPNRILLINTNNEYKSFVRDYTESATLKTVEGKVAAVVDIYNVKLDIMLVAITRTPACNSFSLAIETTAFANTLNDLSMIQYVEEISPTRYNTDFYYDEDEDLAAQITGINLLPDTEYEVITVCYDDWGIASGVGRYPFKTPSGKAALPEYPADSFVNSYTGEIFEMPANNSRISLKK